MIHILVNPTSANGAGKKTFKKVEPVLKKEGTFYTVHMLESGEHTIQVARDLSGVATDREPVHMVIIGGDGTLNLVLQGIVNFENTYISVIKTGSGNDFARSMGVISDPAEAIKSILHSPSHLTIDYGVARFKPVNCLEGVSYELDSRGLASRRFMISCGFGYDADICEEANRSRFKKILNKIKLGMLIYVLVGVKQVFTRVNTPVEVTTDSFSGRISHMFMCATMIQKYEGGGVPFCPHADCRDGKLSICLVRGMSKIKLLSAIVAVYSERHLKFKGVTEYKTNSITLKAATPQWMHMDGEVGCQTKVLYVENKTGLNFIK